MAMDLSLENAKKSRTPVQWVQEICDKQGTVTKWEIVDLVRRERGQSSLFKATLTLLYKGTELTADGEYGNKRQAKQLAANKMLDECMGLVPQDYLNLAASSRAASKSGHGSSSNTAAANRKVTDTNPKSSASASKTVPDFGDFVKNLPLNYHCGLSMEECLKLVSHTNHVYRRMTGELLTKLKEEGLRGIENPAQYLEKMAIESKFTLKYTDHKFENSVGITLELARREAAENTLQHLQIVTR